MRIETKRFVIGDLERNDSFIGIVGMRVEDTLKISSYRRWEYVVLVVYFGL